MKISDIRSAAKFRQTVLLIDDQSTVLDIHAAILRSLKLNLNIVCMTNPIEALEWIKSKPVDLIISDFRMHHMDGMQFVETINSIGSGPPKPIIMVTVLREIELHQELISAGASACLTKPVQAEKLAKIARALLEQSKKMYSQGMANN